MALFYGQKIKGKYINVMFVYINVVLYTSVLCLCISMSCCIHQCYIKGLSSRMDAYLIYFYRPCFSFIKHDHDGHGWRTPDSQTKLTMSDLDATLQERCITENINL